MEIDRSNYELWIIDYLDGNLDAVQLNMLKDFLRDNADISQEAGSFEQIEIISNEDTYLFKESLLKNPSEISDEQFSYMCIAYAENDLSASQSSELLEIIKKNPLKQKTFDLINKTKLSPGNIVFVNKRQLKKHVILSKRTLSIAIAGLSIAASIALLIIPFVDLSEKETSLVPVISSTQSTLNEIHQSILIEPNEIIDQQPIRNKISQNNIEKTDSNTLSYLENTFPISELATVSKLPVPEAGYITKVILPFPICDRSLAPVNSFTNTQGSFEENSRLKNYLTGFFRNKILKDEEPETGSIKGYEIADASIIGLNKLLGWEMSLEKMKYDNGELSNLVFSSRLVKFNAPVKNFKTEE